MFQAPTTKTSNPSHAFLGCHYTAHFLVLLPRFGLSMIVIITSCVLPQCLTCLLFSYTILLSWHHHYSSISCPNPCSSKRPEKNTWPFLLVSPSMFMITSTLFAACAHSPALLDNCSILSTCLWNLLPCCLLISLLLAWRGWGRQLSQAPLHVYHLPASGPEHSSVWMILGVEGLPVSPVSLVSSGLLWLLPITTLPSLSFQSTCLTSYLSGRSFSVSASDAFWSPDLLCPTA